MLGLMVKKKNLNFRLKISLCKHLLRGFNVMVLLSTQNMFGLLIKEKNLCYMLIFFPFILASVY